MREGETICICIIYRESLYCIKKIFSGKESVAILKKKLGPAERRKAHNSVVLLIKGEKLERGMHKQKEKSTDQESQRPPASDMSREGWRSLTFSR